jgi:D-citramalate synthase
MNRNIEIMDTTLRDGEQTTGVSYSASEKVNIAKVLLEDVKVDRIEIASARVSEGEFRAAQEVFKWAKQAGFLDKVEVLGFVDKTESVDWIIKAGGKVINLLTKGSLRHVKEQLRKTPEQHVKDIKEVINYAISKGFIVNIYLEDWSNGMKNSPEYVFFMIDSLKDEKIQRFMIPDTLGILNPSNTYEFCKTLITKYPELHFDFHPHNDYDLAAGNTFGALQAGIHGIHTTVNGLGERAGNVPLSSVVAIIKDQLNLNTSVNESKLTFVSKLVESFSGIRIPSNKPIIGEFVFTQCSGIHADGDSKNGLYFNDLLPERFGRERQYALGKMSGKASIKKNLEILGIELDTEEMKKVTQRVIELGDRKEYITAEDLPYIISDVLNSGQFENAIKVKNYNLSVTEGLKSTATIKISVFNKDYQETASGDGQYDAFMKALWKIYDKLGKQKPVLTDYVVTIPPGGKTDALVEAIISWNYNGRQIKTKGLDSDQVVAAIKATIKMLNLIEKNK